MPYRRRAIGFYSERRGRRRRVRPITEPSGHHGYRSEISQAQIRSDLYDRKDWPQFNSEIWGWYWEGSRWKPIYAKSSARREYDTGTGYTAPTIHPVKLEQRRRLDENIQGRGGTVLELYAGRGNLSRHIYAKRGRKLILVDSDAEALQQAHQKLRGRCQHETIAKDNVRWIEEEMEPEELSDLLIVDFDAFGSPAEPAKAFFANYPVKKSMYVAFTDGSALHSRYCQDEEGKKWLRHEYGVNRIPNATREGSISTLDRFMQIQGREHGFKADKVSVAHGDANTVYVGYKISPARDNRLQAWKTEKMKIRFVNGEYVRNKHDVDFTQGGHHLAPGKKYIPEGEIWIDNKLSRIDREATILHERKEHRLMEASVPYEKAHDIATIREKTFRRSQA